MNARRLLVRIVGIALIVAGIAGLIFSAAGLVVLAHVEKQVETALTEQLELVNRTLTATAEGLSVAEASLAAATEAVKAVEETMGGLSQTLNSTAPMLDAVTGLLGEQLPATIETTQETLMAVADSAKLVDDILALVTSIPFLGLDAYSPDVPLTQGFTEVASSLDGIPDSLTSAQKGLVSTKDDLRKVESDFAAMAESIGAIATDLEDAQSVLVQYQDIASDLQDVVASARESLPTWLWMLQIGLSLVLVWLGVAQLALITQGWELIGRSRVSGAAESATDEGKL
jgi:chromosome segregation ATPase